MSYPIIKKFMLTNGPTGLQLFWKTGNALPDFSTMSVVAARATSGGFEWATAEVMCPHCQHHFSIEDKMGSTDFSELLLSPNAAVLVDLLGNVSIDTGTPVNITCPECRKVFPVVLEADETELVIAVYKDRITVKCPSGQIVDFCQDGRVLAARKTPERSSNPGVFEFQAIPDKPLGKSKEAAEWLGWALEIRPNERPKTSNVDLLDLALKYRFKGYGEAFVAEAKTCLAQKNVRPEALNGLFTLPRNAPNGDVLTKLLEYSGLPDKPSVRKAAGERPVALAFMLNTKLGSICGGDPNLAVTLLHAKSLTPAWIDSLLDEKGNISQLILLAAAHEKPNYLIKKLLSIDSKVLGRCVFEFEKLGLDPFEELVAYGLARKDYSLTELLSKPKLFAVYADSDESIPIHYGNFLALEGEYEGFSFRLPEQTGVFKTAGAALKNCLGDGYSRSVALGSTLVFLVSHANNLVAAVEVSPGEMSIRQMLAKANRWILPSEDLGIAIAMWARDKGLQVKGCNYA